MSELQGWRAVTVRMMVAVTVAGAVADTVITARSGPGPLASSTLARHGWPLVPCATIGSSVVGALILSRYPRHLIGWLLLVTGTVTEISLTLESYSIWVHRDGGPGGEHAWQLAGWLSLLFSGGSALSLLAIVFLTAPDGHLLSRRWRPVLWICLAGLVLYCASALAMRPSQVVVDAKNPEFPSLAAVLGTAAALCTAVGTIGAAVSMVVRLRRAAGEARLQLRWFAVAVTLLAATFVWLIVVQAGNGQRQTITSSVPLFLAFALLPVFVAVAVLRHRLYDIDLIVSRAALVTVATVTVAVGYVVVVVAVAGAASGGVGPSLLATAVVAIAFQPLRTRILRLAHRLAYGQRAAPYEALADLSRRLGESGDPEQLLPAAAQTFAGAVAASRATVALVVPGAPDVTAVWPAEASEPAEDRTTTLLVEDHGEAVGRVAVTLPPGRSLRPSERQLLTRLADQTAVALRNARLSAELADRVHQLDRSSRDLARSRARLIAARDTERGHLAATIRRDVLAHVEPLPARLEALVDQPSRLHRQDELVAMTAATTTALEALRTISHGVYPAQLARSGLVSVLARSVDVDVELDDSVQGRRFDERAEATAYFCFAAATSALAAPVQGWVGLLDGDLVLRLSGTETGHGDWSRVRDRVEALGGELTRTSVDGCAVVALRLPLRAAVAEPAPVMGA